MGKNSVISLLIVLILLLGCSSASASPTAKMVCGVVTNVVSALLKWLVSLTYDTEPEISSRSMVKFESGYNVETIFDGNKLGVEPYSVVVSPAGEVFILDSENSNIYKIPTTPHSLYSRPVLVVGSVEGCSGHVDGKPREARKNHPKGLAMDDNGNIYVADTMNMAIRKITKTGVVTIARGKRFHGDHHDIDRPSEDARLSSDFDLVYVRSSCSLLVIDRGNWAIKEIRLRNDDCSYQYDYNLHLGAALLCVACFFGYVLALLQRRIATIFSSNREPRTQARGNQPRTEQHPSVQANARYGKPEENPFVTMGRILINTGSSAVEIFGAMFPTFRKKCLQPRTQHDLHYSRKHSNSWSTKEDKDEDEVPFIDPANDSNRNQQHFRQRNSDIQNGYFHQQQQVQQMHHHHKKQSSSPRTYIERSCETNEVFFGAVQEHDGCREPMVIETIDYSDPAYNHYNIRSRYNCKTDSFYSY